MLPSSLRARLALLYAGVFIASAVLVLAVPFLSVSEKVHAGSGGPPVVSHPGLDLHPQVTALLVSLAIIVVVSLGLGWLLSGRLLRPLRLIVSTAREISATNLSRRLRTSGRDDEFSRLGQTLNDLFARLEGSFESQRRFVANAAHELRTPLTAERTVLQVALADADASATSLRAACEEVLRLGEQQEKLIDALLTLAVSERGVERAEPFDLADIAATATRSLDIGRRLAPAPATGDPRLAGSLVANLAGNAVRHNVPGGWATIETWTEDGHGVIGVANSGPVVPAAELDRLFHPFQRLGGERVRGASGGGHGLGLAIASAIAAAHGAELRAVPRPEGGLDITVRFPAGPPAAGPPADGPASGERTAPRP